MYKKLLYYMMIAGCGTRLISTIVLSILNAIHLPVFVVMLSLCIVGLGIFMIVKGIVGKIKLFNLVAYHVTADLGTVLSFIILHFYAVDISMIETLITGSVLSILLSVTALFLTFRKKRYVTIRRREQLQLTSKEK